jgi:hypothetical protein
VLRFQGFERNRSNIWGKQLEELHGIQRVRGGFRVLSVIEATFGERLDIKVIDNSISFVRRVETHNFDAG